MGFHIYPVTETGLRCEAYEVKVNGTAAPLNTARVSAFPLNRRWPGHQRSMDQTELVNFFSMEADERLEFEICPKEAFENVVIRPLELGIVPQLTEQGHIHFTLEKPAYFTVEPYGRRNALHIFVDSVQKSAAPAGDKVLYFGKGEHDVGMIQLESGQTLYIDEGAVVYACVRAIDARDIRITGRGILDNSRNTEKILFSANAEGNTAEVSNAKRTKTIELEYCENVSIDGITIRDSLVYNIRPMGCKNVDIRDVKIIGCWRYNSDGIDMHNCEDVTIENCFIRTFDDCICVKGFDCYYEGDVAEAVKQAMYRGGKCYDTFRNVRVRNCVLWNDWGKALEIGAETRAEEICNIHFQDCHVIHVTGPALDCKNVDFADVHNVVFENISVEMDEIVPKPVIQTQEGQVYVNPDLSFSPRTIWLEVCYHPEYSAGGERRGKNREFLFENIRYYGKNLPKFYFCGYSEENAVSDITVRGFSVNGEPLAENGYELTVNRFCKDLRIETT